MKTERKVDEWRCDNPACEKTILHDPETSAKPNGYHGTVDLVVGGKSVVGGPWFAHTVKCVSGAVAAASSQAGAAAEDEPHDSFSEG